MNIDTTLLDNEEWGWRNTANIKIQQWVLMYKHSTHDNLIMASIIRTPVPDYRIIIRSKEGLTSTDDRATDLETAMLAAETYMTFNRGSIW